MLQYGDEIGMGDDLSLPEREAARTPMQWSAEPNAGFTIAQRPLRPLVSDPIYGFQRVNVGRHRRLHEERLNIGYVPAMAAIGTVRKRSGIRG